MLKQNDRIRLTTDLGWTHSRKGDFGTIVAVHGSEKPYPYEVRVDNDPTEHPWPVHAREIEPVREEVAA